MASFASYRLEKAISKYRHEFGHGAIEGVAGPETANNAAATSTMVPLLALGIPTGAVTALMFSALMVHNVQPGPLLMAQHPEIFFGVIMSMYVGNVILLILNVPLISVWVSLLRVPQNILLPAILLVSFVGSYSVNGSMLDLWLLLVFGAVGYILQKLDFTLAPMVIAIVLGPMIEKHLREGLTMSLGDITIFFNSPIAASIWAVVLFLVTLNFWNGLLKRLLTFLKSF
jgi:putative tricarboxylic transport membrane protein